MWIKLGLIAIVSVSTWYACELVYKLTFGHAPLVIAWTWVRFDPVMFALECVTIGTALALMAHVYTRGERNG